MIWATTVVGFSSIAWKDEEVPYGPAQYDPVKAEAYYSKRWATKFGRGMQLLYNLGGWGIGVLRDKYEFGGANWQKNMPMRAKQILKICTKLGTTSIKIGQALSIRTDLLPEPYVKELSELQDRVQPFPTSVSRKILMEELGLEAPGALEKVFPEISAKPVASASIGQVYKAKLADGTEVAIKVQRPGVIRDIALDLYLSRTVLPIYKSFMKLK
jgi:predicted unusual protein kinase regulating ubiquinone biosynthesis (AarF/ABC1/UbiB family)